jgi:hypothetical protein
MRNKGQARQYIIIDYYRETLVACVTAWDTFIQCSEFVAHYTYVHF